MPGRHQFHGTCACSGAVSTWRKCDASEDRSSAQLFAASCFAVSLGGLG